MRLGQNLEVDVELAVSVDCAPATSGKAKPVLKGRGTHEGVVDGTARDSQGRQPHDKPRGSICVQEPRAGEVVR